MSEDYTVIKGMADEILVLSSRIKELEVDKSNAEYCFRELKKINEQLEKELAEAKKDIEILASDRDMHVCEKSAWMAALEALQKQNNALKLMCESKASLLAIIDKQLFRMPSLESDNKGLKECNAILTDETAAQAKRIAELEESGDMKTELLSKCEAEIKILRKQIEELESGIGCTRSHPHENMNEVCKLKTDYAKQIFEDQAEIEALRKHLFEVVNDCIMLDSECSKFESVTKANEYLSAPEYKEIE
jgi:chromosome segregation ATPase